jgi:predicted RNA-binding Zn-ribbon protein involved in translation (DUF1610 family)
VGRRGVKEYRAPEALTLIAADREHTPLVCPSCGTRSIHRVPRRRSSRPGAASAERISLTCQTCGRHASYIERGAGLPVDDTVNPRTEPEATGGHILHGKEQHR